jgi:hypothetical protein
VKAIAFTTVFLTLQETQNEQQKGFYPYRAFDRGRHYRHSCRDRDSEVREHQGKGVRRSDEV